MFAFGGPTLQTRPAFPGARHDPELPVFEVRSRIKQGWLIGRPRLWGAESGSFKGKTEPLGNAHGFRDPG